VSWLKTALLGIAIAIASAVLAIVGYVSTHAFFVTHDPVTRMPQEPVALGFVAAYGALALVSGAAGFVLGHQPWATPRHGLNAGAVAGAVLVAAWTSRQLAAAVPLGAVLHWTAFVVIGLPALSAALGCWSVTRRRLA